MAKSKVKSSGPSNQTQAAEADALYAKASAVEVETQAQFEVEKAYRIDHNTNFPYDTGPEYDAHVKEYNRLEVLQQQLKGYKAAVIPGWKGGIGQPNHSTIVELLQTLAVAYPEASAAVTPRLEGA